MAAALDLDNLPTPVPAWLRRTGIDDVQRDLQIAVDRWVVDPLKASHDEDAWHSALVDVFPRWLGLRLELVRAGIAVFGLDELEEAIASLDRLPLTLLPEPAHGAARFAVDHLRWLGLRGLAAARAGIEPDSRVFGRLIDQVAVVELCWLTLIGPRRPCAQAAEAAAWEAYCRTRLLSQLVIEAGFGEADLPVESADEATERGRALIARLAGLWSPADTDAVVPAFSPGPA